MTETTQTPMVLEDRYDAVFIGSGMGSLTTASLLSQVQNKKVLILERHFTLGGFTHTFRRGKFHWDVGIHYVGGMGESEMSRVIFDKITRGKVQWNKMAEPFEKFRYPGLEFSLYGDSHRFQEDLVHLFPSEKDSIQRYFQDIKSMTDWFGRHFTLKALPSFFERAAHLLKLTGHGHAYTTTKEYMDQNFKEEKLKAILVSQWGDFGLPPSLSSFAIHALIVQHYFNGGYYPVGSGASILKAIQPIIEGAGGKLLANAEVTEVLIQEGKAVGVKFLEKKAGVASEKIVYSEVVISDAGAFNTYLKLVPKSFPLPFREELEKTPPGMSHVTLYIGLKQDPKVMGFRGENYWIFNDFDHEKNYQSRNDILEGKSTGLYLSFPSLKDPSTDGQSHTAEAISFVDFEPFQKWSSEKWKKRGEEYESLKNQITKTILDRLESEFPGFNSMVEFTELSTPVTNVTFTDHPQGTIYGIPCTPERFRKEWLGSRTPIENLYLTGADASSPGIMGAVMGGVSTACIVLGISGILRLLKELKSN